MSDEILIKAENVGKKFCRNLKKSLLYGMQDVSYDLLGKDRVPGIDWEKRGRQDHAAENAQWFNQTGCRVY